MVEPIPMMIASTITLTPEATTLPRVFSARNAVLAPQRERHEDEACKRRQLELDQRDKQLNREDEEGEHDQNPAKQQDQDRPAGSVKTSKPENWLISSSNG